MNSKFPEKNGNYSPSARYLYGGQSQQHQHPHQNQSHRREQQHNKHPHQSDRIIKQNDIVIRLLKEIRDQLAKLTDAMNVGKTMPADELAPAVAAEVAESVDAAAAGLPREDITGEEQEDGDEEFPEDEAVNGNRISD